MSKKRRNKDDEKITDADRDPLGKLMQRYYVSLLGILLVSGVVALVGIVLVIVSQFRDQYSLVFLLVGTGVLLLSLVLLGMNVFNVGRRLELRKRGIRYV